MNSSKVINDLEILLVVIIFKTGMSKIGTFYQHAKYKIDEILILGHDGTIDDKKCARRDDG